MNILDKLKWRYAVKKFDSERKLSDEKLNILKEAFNLTATSYGLQPVKLLIIENKQLKEELVTHSWNQRQVADASHLLVFCIHRNVDALYIKTYFERVKHVRNTPDEILDPFRNYLIDDFGSKDQQEVDDWAIKQAYLVLGNLLTVCAAEQIDSCPMEGFVSEKYDELLDLPKKNLKSVLVMPVGYRAADDMFADFKKVRKELSEAIEEII
ncbi:NAD(P)H-dependent oxidoreductase [Zhouia spongiae]|uniref:NAD(P)H-dependent oxidoreductase n=1 Tax=Zhouia spongiae TaxID=2202721 RepID=A0ABY3YJ31_9FLAO|nr:NAD(P)H-dependent oxidoreductase [Zhouia spongiae]UNY97842.1 NAD(P)H-dependent oxidoreductase [Zhouia spongiae]